MKKPSKPKITIRKPPASETKEEEISGALDAFVKGASVVETVDEEPAIVSEAPVEGPVVEEPMAEGPIEREERVESAVAPPKTEKKSRRKKSLRRKQVTFYLDADLHKKLKIKAVTEEIDMSDLANEAIIKMLRAG